MRYLWVIGGIILSSSLANASAEALPTESQNHQYTLEYDPTSPIKEVPLKEALLKLELYKFHLPKGTREVTTDSAQKFILEDQYDLEVTSISEEKKYGAHCSGYATVQDPIIKITCSKTQ